MVPGKGAERPGVGARCEIGAEKRNRETNFGLGVGINGFYVDDDAELIRIFDIVWADFG